MWIAQTGLVHRFAQLSFSRTGIHALGASLRPGRDASQTITGRNDEQGPQTQGMSGMKTTLGKCIVFSFLNVIILNAHSEWKCYAGDQGGHYWMSTGMTQERATAVALSFCGAYSPNSDTCNIDKCIENPT